MEQKANKLGHCLLANNGYEGHIGWWQCRRGHGKGSRREGPPNGERAHPSPPTLPHPDDDDLAARNGLARGGGGRRHTSP